MESCMSIEIKENCKKWVIIKILESIEIVKYTVNFNRESGYILSLYIHIIKWGSKFVDDHKIVVIAWQPVISSKYFYYEISYTYRFPIRSNQSRMISVTYISCNPSSMLPIKITILGLFLNTDRVTSLYWFTRWVTVLFKYFSVFCVFWGSLS